MSRGDRLEEKRQAEAAIVEQKFDQALRLFVAHCGGDVGQATTAQREAFDQALADIAAHLADLAIEGVA